MFTDGSVVSPVHQKELNTVEYSSDPSHSSIPFFVTVSVFLTFHYKRNSLLITVLYNIGGRLNVFSITHFY